MRYIYRFRGVSRLKLSSKTFFPKKTFLEIYSTRNLIISSKIFLGEDVLKRNLK